MSKVSFITTVDSNITPPIFTFYNNKAQATDGSVIVTPDECTEISYILEMPSLIFVKPAITNNFNNDVTYIISEDKKNITLNVNRPPKGDDVGIQLIVQNITTNQLYASPDPRIRAGSRR